MSFYIKIKRSWLVKTTEKKSEDFPCVVTEKKQVQRFA